MSDQGAVRYQRTGAVAHITFDRPAARNAMTWTMYEQMAGACKQVAADKEVRVAVFRGAGGKAFVAGTDIGQFRDFKTAEDGVEYERKVAQYLLLVEELPVPTLAVIEGWAIGGGLAIATACDLRIATPGSRFGVPIARTLGNCLSVENNALLVSAFGVARTKKMLILAENLTAEEATSAGFLAEIVPPENLDARMSELCARLAGNAPVTMRVTKEAIRR
ncbi:MAG: enoyl-CoA hydratase, partial [Burkholderiales bacterium]|nr:enoyl-CoA hydratase [Burkholderiales bacterium]